MRTIIISTLLLACGPSNQNLGYTETARFRYEQGVEALEDDDYLEANRHLLFVKNKFAYSKYAALAELRIADAHFKQEKYIEAIDAYRSFLQGRPRHQEVPYARWRVGLAYFEQVPSDFFLFPPAHEKDQGPTKDALRALQTYLNYHPKHEKAEAAQKKVRLCRAELAAHELYVASFYLMMKRPRSAQGRLEMLVEVYEDLPHYWTSGAWKLVEVYSELKQLPKAIQLAHNLIKRFPQSDEAKQAQRFLNHH